jgi:hypothetical protein
MPLVLSIGSCLCCWPVGIACLVMFFQGKTMADQGDTGGAEAKLKTVKTLGIVGIVVGLIINIVAIIAQVAMHM